MQHAYPWQAARAALVAGAILAAGLFAATPVAADGDRDDDRRADRHCDGKQAIRLVNGRIHTMDRRDSVVRSVLIKDGRFAALGGRGAGDDDDRCTKTIDLRGRTAVPGIIDNHNHIILLGLRPGHDTRLENANSIREALDTLASRAADVPAGEWITSIGGFSRNQFFLADGAARFPTLQELDKAVPHHPVFLFESFTGPSATNSLGKAFFESHGITVGADGSIAIAPFGGTGPSLQALFELRKIQTFNEQKRGLRDAMAYAASVGITTHLDQGGFPYKDSGVDNTDGAANFDRYRAFDSVQALYQEGKLTNRIWINFLHLEEDPATPELQARLLNVFPDFGDDMLRILGIGEFTAGPFFFPGSASWQNGTRLVAKAGWRNENHSLSPTDFKTIIDNWQIVHDELVAQGNPDGIKKLRWVVAHVPFITPEYLTKLKNLGGGVSLLGGWRWLTGSSANNGPPFRTVRDSGIRAGMSSDGMQISTMSPWINLYYVVTGKNARGELINAGQTLTRQEGLRLYTADNGWFLNAEDKLGTIEEGKYADLIVLSDNYFDPARVPDEKIKDIHSVLTIVNGKIVHDDLDHKRKKYWHRGWRRDHR
ncbi:MAG TPA: amidohydrolase family protein [Dehalococcoidia bacterium]|nr:amidohydrolase family protein [Dehalococcoidia bacterium]